jgi:hypothetical protein
MDKYEKAFAMTYAEAAIIILDIPIYGNDNNNDYYYSIPEYQAAKALAIQALLTKVPEEGEVE